jgi:tetratricopeptide (TPR) repeat protein
MIDTSRASRPLDDAESAIRTLDEYQSASELGAAIQTTYQAVERTLRNLLRLDPQAPDDLRVAALSASELPLDRLIPALRQRDLISMQLAGMVHELEQANRRAAEGAARAADGDHARNAVQQLRSELSRASDRPVMQAAHNAVESGVLEQTPQPVPPARPSRRLLAAAGALLFVLALLVVTFTMLTGDSDFDKGKAAFEGQQWSAAEEHLKKAAEDDNNVAAQLYLARVYRSTKQYDQAATVLRKAANNYPNDVDVQRELGKLFLDLNQPAQAVKYLRRAQEQEPDDKATWIWLIQALRAAGDPSAEETVEKAPAEVRAMLAK